MNKVIPKILSFPLVALCLPVLAQTVQKPLSQMPASARQLIAVKVTGSKRYPESAVAAASGLQLGAPVTDDDFKKAARRLGDTGVFADIAYSFSYSPAGTKLEFHVTDAAKFVPVHFEDFVWFSDEELNRRLKEHLPLFDGQVPVFGQMADQVSDVLQAMLVERQIPGHVEYQRLGKQDAPVESIDYRVNDVLIHVRNIEFTGAAAEDVPALEEAGRRLGDREYSRTRLAQFAQKQLLAVYHERGYLKARFGEPQPKVVKEPSAENDEGPRNQTVVDVTFAVTPGEQYQLKSLEWTGNHEFPAETLQKMVRAELGKPANTIRLGDNLKDIQKLYSSRGFIMASIKPDATFDDAAASVSIRLEVNEGSVFHMGELEYRGLDNSLTAKLRNIWKIRPGDVYNAGYLGEYIPQAQKLLPANLDWEVDPHVTANVREKTVDVDLIYTVKAPK